MHRTLLVAAVVMAAGCGLDLDGPKKGGQDAKKEPAQKKSKPDVKEETSVRACWDEYVTDAVAWQEKFAGRYAALHPDPPFAIHKDGKGFYVLQGYVNGTRDESVRVYFRDADAKKLSSMLREKENVFAWRFRVLIDEEGFGFSDGHLVGPKE